MRIHRLRRFLLLPFLGALRVLAAPLDLAEATVVVPPWLDGPERKAAVMLVEP